MKKKAIFTIMIGENDIYPMVKANFQYYADRIGADLIVCDKPAYSMGYLSRGAHGVYGLERIQIERLLEKYERVLCLDSDIIIKPDAPDIFEENADETYLYMYNEGKVVDRSNLLMGISCVLFEKYGHPQIKKNADYYNVGVMLFSQAHRGFFEYISMEDIGNVISKVDLFEQTYFNFIFLIKNIPVKSLSFKFNRMDILGGHFRKLNSHFIHYAGSGFTGKHKVRYQMMKMDLLTLFPETLGSPNLSDDLSALLFLRKILYNIYFPFNVKALLYF